MGVVVMAYRDHKRLVGLPDPAGGLFDAAGDFDRLLDVHGGDGSVLGDIDRQDDVVLRQSSMAALIDDIIRLFAEAHSGAEHRGLARLQVLARLCADDATIELRFMGD